MYKPTTKELDAIVVIGLTTAVVLASAGFGMVGAALVGICAFLAEYWRTALRSARTGKQTGS